MNDLKRQRWTGGELLACALLELLIVNIAYRIDRRKRAPFLSTAAWAILLGVGFGLFLSSISKDASGSMDIAIFTTESNKFIVVRLWSVVLQRAADVGLDPQALFFGLLPPIILDAGFSTQRRGFFANFWDVFLLGVVGTVLAACLTGTLIYWIGQTSVLSTAFTPAEAILYGSLISAIDPLATQLVLRKSHVPPLIPELVFGERSLNNAICT